jgi:arylsulfatase A-like enzyme
MPGVLYAWGDGIARGREVESIDAIDLHPTVMRLLDVQPGQPVDGKVEPRLLAP